MFRCARFLGFTAFSQAVGDQPDDAYSIDDPDHAGNEGNEGDEGVVETPEDYDNDEKEEIDVTAITNDAHESVGRVEYDVSYAYDDLEELSAPGRLGGDRGGRPPQVPAPPPPPPLQGTPTISVNGKPLPKGVTLRDAFEAYEPDAPGPLLGPLPGPYYD